MIRYLLVLLLLTACSHSPEIEEKFAEQDRQLAALAADLNEVRADLATARAALASSEASITETQRKLLILREAFRRIVRDIQAIGGGLAEARAEFEAALMLVEAQTGG